MKIRIICIMFGIVFLIIGFLVSKYGFPIPFDTNSTYFKKVKVFPSILQNFPPILKIVYFIERGIGYLWIMAGLFYILLAFIGKEIYLKNLIPF